MSKESALRGAILEEKPINDHTKPAQASRDHQYCEPVLAQMWMVTTKTAIEQCPLSLQRKFRKKEKKWPGNLWKSVIYNGVLLTIMSASGAGDGGRTRDIDLGKVALYH